MGEEGEKYVGVGVEDGLEVFPFTRVSAAHQPTGAMTPNEPFLIGGADL